MKKTLLAVLFVGVFAVALTGCNLKKKEETKKLDVKGPRVVCEISEKSGGIATTQKTTLKFDKDNYLSYQATESTAKFDDKEQYKIYVEESEKSEDINDIENIEFSISKNDKEKLYSTTLIYTEKFLTNMLKEASEEEKEEYAASSIISKYEEVGMKCKYVELSKSDLGIK